MKIKYIGGKDFKGDNVGGNTGLIWAQGEVIDVPDDKAQLFLAHPDVWEKAAKNAKVSDQKAIENPKVEENEPEEEAVLAAANVDAMDKDSLLAYAKRTFGVDLDAERTEDALRDDVNNLIGGKPVVQG